MPEALPIRPFCKKGDFTWADWEKEAREKYPVRYFLSQTIPHWWAVNVSISVTEFVYWVKCHVIPSKRYHMLDLRQPKTIAKYDPDHYRYGYLDGDHKILYACFNSLVHFIEKEHKGKFLEYVTFQEEAMGSKHLELRELFEIYQWWTTTRKTKQKEYDKALDEWHVLLMATSNSEEQDVLPGFREAEEKHKALEKEFKEEETRMLIRLIEIREYMWS